MSQLVIFLLALVQAALPVEAASRDGAVLRGLRYPGRGYPVVLLHGLGTSLLLFDPPAGAAPGLARSLQGEGFDVWLFNFRGSGQGPLRSLPPPGRGYWCADELILEDIPAILGRVRAATGRAPIALGYSLGGMCLAAWLAGADWADPSRPDLGVRIERRAAAERNRELRGAVFLAAPARLSWSAWREPRLLRDLSRWIEVGPAPLLLPEMLHLSRWNLEEPLRPLPAFLVRKAEAAVLRQLSGIDLLEQALGSDPEAAARRLETFRAGILSDVPRDLLLQLADGVREGSWRSFRGPAGRRASFPDHYRNVKTPVLVVAGEKDGIAEPGVIRGALYEELGSRDRALVLVPDHRHLDLLLGDRAPREVFGPLAEWLRRQAVD